MKKMFFTAIALVAFSATSMAKTVEVNEVLIPVEEKEELVILPSCQVIMTYVYEYNIVKYNCGEDDIVMLNELMSLCN